MSSAHSERIEFLVYSNVAVATFDESESESDSESESESEKKEEDCAMLQVVA